MSLKCVKCLFSFLCVLLLCLGIALAALSLWVRYDDNSWMQLLYPSVARELAPVFWIFAIIGIVVAIVALIGIFGAFRDSRCCLITFFVVVLIALVALIACVIAVVVLIQLDPEAPTRVFYQRFVTSYSADNSFLLLMDQLQHELRCCGVYNYTDYLKTPWYNVSYSSQSSREKVPVQCCSVYPAKSVTESQLEDDCKTLSNVTLVYPVGCSHALQNWFGKHRGWVITVTVLIGMVQLVLLILAWNINSRVRGQYERGHYA